LRFSLTCDIVSDGGDDSALATDLSQQQVRDAGMAAGLVDFKICAIDDTWSALLFRQRKV
jgi:hypothetical protein